MPKIASLLLTHTERECIKNALINSYWKESVFHMHHIINTIWDDGDQRLELFRLIHSNRNESNLMYYNTVHQITFILNYLSITSCTFTCIYITGTCLYTIYTYTFMFGCIYKLQSPVYDSSILDLETNHVEPDENGPYNLEPNRNVLLTHTETVENISVGVPLQR